MWGIYGSVNSIHQYAHTVMEEEEFAFDDLGMLVTYNYRVIVSYFMYPMQPDVGSCQTCSSSLHIEQKNPFIQNVNRHMYNLEKLSRAADDTFFTNILVNPDWKYLLLRYHLEKLPFNITLLWFYWRHQHWVKLKWSLSQKLPFYKVIVCLDQVILVTCFHDLDFFSPQSDKALLSSRE